MHISRACLPAHSRLRKSSARARQLSPARASSLSHPLAPNTLSPNTCSSEAVEVRPNPFQIFRKMNHRAKHLSSSSRRGTGAPAAPAAGSASVAGTPAALAVISAPATGDTTTNPQVAGVPAWWTTSSLEAYFRHDSSPTGRYGLVIQTYFHIFAKIEMVIRGG